MACPGHDRLQWPARACHPVRNAGAGAKPALSGPSFRDEAHARQALEMPIARQHVCAMSLGCRVDDSVRRRELALSSTERCGGERDRRIEIHDDARLGKGDDLIGLSSPTSRVSHLVNSS
jgi:hypothetical protein